jgi:plastocyanin
MLIFLPPISFNMHRIYIFVILPIVFALTVHISTTEIFAQTGSMTGIGADADYAVSIVPGASLINNTFHYYPPKVAVPTDTTVAWLNLDVGQPHTVTSGQPESADSGAVFNSGVMPSFPVRSFEFTFSQPGNFSYYCIIHPWRVASVSVSDASYTGQSFDVDLGAGATWDISNTPRTLLEITPKTVSLDGVTPLTYNVTIADGATNQTMFSGLYTTGGDPLSLELISGPLSGHGNQTTSYGPDFSTVGAYHIQSDFKKGSSYLISTEVISSEYKPLANPVKATFNLQTNP